MRQRKPTKREARKKKPRPVEEEKPDGLPEVAAPAPAWAREMQKRLK